MHTDTLQYGFATTLDVPFDEAVRRTRAALASQGFGVAAEIDMAATFREKLGTSFRPYVILGACNPALAQRALDADLNIGLLLPCNVVVYAGDDGGTSVVAALDPERQMQLAGGGEGGVLAPIAHEAAERLRRAMSALE
ncbi:MAG TPA: DUF302 domain-containing protein [Gemmatimonadaceae bacterium]|nr:DUF302 domain-containing protein [Gemmatimonadaceae bacterium]